MRTVAASRSSGSRAFIRSLKSPISSSWSLSLWSLSTRHVSHEIMRCRPSSHRENSVGMRTSLLFRLLRGRSWSLFLENGGHDFVSDRAQSVQSVASVVDAVRVLRASSRRADSCPIEVPPINHRSSSGKSGRVICRQGTVVEEGQRWTGRESC